MASERTIEARIAVCEGGGPYTNVVIEHDPVDMAYRVYVETLARPDGPRVRVESPSVFPYTTTDENGYHRPGDVTIFMAYRAAVQQACNVVLTS